jgi:hypothetical protein
MKAGWMVMPDDRHSMTVGELGINFPVADAMGARISVASPPRGMYLITGHDTSLESLVRTTGGTVVLRLSHQKMLINLSFAGYLSLQGNHQISHIGPVTVDVERLAKVAESVANASSTRSDNAP